ncbi:MAG TPA: DUF1552 domain-containing protein [Candidatus Hydrogenedentes bacterium]|nr:DUF1552 domain-containing protein [Candidatus Hydrogenedentota bacterium]HRK32991.1 DUF1552 domain-containing protein [Candidatus Hydrogenedentota bacterium]
MSSKSWQISRRTMLRGMGAALALPLLDAMAPSVAQAATRSRKAPVRMACIYFPNGVWTESWIPKGTGADFELPYSLEPLAEFKSSLNILSGLDKAESKGGDGHYAKTANFLTGLKVNKTTGKDISVGGISMDQLAAEHVGKYTPLPSMELGIDPVISGIDSNVGFTRLYGSYISWRSANVPVAKEINPRFVYERLFGTEERGGRAEKKRARDFQSLLDLALDDANRLRGQLGRDDQVKLDEYLESVRAVETRIEYSLSRQSGRWQPDPEPTIPEAPGEKPPADFREHVKLMLDLMVLAFQTDSTRVQSFMFANDVSGRNFSFLPGVSGGHHDMSHHENKEEKIAQYREITKWHTSQLAYLLGKMRSIPEGDSNLLDNSMVLFGSSISDGNRHDPNNLPIIVAGGGGGALRTGQHVANPKGTPLCNLYVSMLNAMGVPAESFGDSTGPLKDIVVT